MKFDLRMTAWVGLVICFLSTPAWAVKSEPRKIILGDRTINAIIDLPSNPGPRPLLIIAPTLSGNAKNRLNEKIAKEAAEAGFAAVRFNWGFENPDTSIEKPIAKAPSPDSKQEAEDLSVVLTSFTSGRVNQHLEIDPKKMALVVQGFSAKVSLMPESKVLTSDLKALFLINPECDGKTPFSKAFSAVVEMKTTRSLLTSKEGSKCELPSDGFSLITLEGDAQFRKKSGNEFSNQDTAAKFIVNGLMNLGWKTTQRGQARAHKNTAETASHSHSH